MKKELFILFILFLTFYGCVKKSTNPFQLAFENNSEEHLKKIIKLWSDKYPPKLDRANLSDTIKVIYDIYESLYHPFIKDYPQKNHNERKELYFSDKYEYVIIPNRITYTVYDSLILPKEILPNTIVAPKEYLLYKSEIKDFRPKFAFGTKQVYLTSEYDSLLQEFLPYVQRSDDNEKYLENNKKRNFLSMYLNYPKYGGYLTYPIINSITINSKLSDAKVSFSYGLAGYSAYFRLENGKWNYKIGLIEWIM